MLIPTLAIPIREERKSAGQADKPLYDRPATRALSSLRQPPPLDSAAIAHSFLSPSAAFFFLLFQCQALPALVASLDESLPISN